MDEIDTHRPSTHSAGLSSRIRKLDPLIIDQIAAGEVIERPSSIVKELVENSCDAGASHIEVSLSHAGSEKIHIVDDGSGMEKDDLLLCMERHATSKLKSIDDLEKISTYGFRGEALSSIASVSKLTVRSRPSKATFGLEIVSHFGDLQKDPRPTAMPEGTQILVESLFERLPARKKFLKTPATELSHCLRVVRELAISNAGVEFVVKNEKSRSLYFPVASRESRVLECFSWDVEPYHFSEEDPKKSIEAFLSPPILRRDKGDLWVCLNGRVIRNKMISHALRQAYLGVCGPHHEPSGVVFLEISDGVDCNAHPQKLEVRLHEGQALFGWIQAVTRKHIANCHRGVTVPIVFGEERRDGRVFSDIALKSFEKSFVSPMKPDSSPITYEIPFEKKNVSVADRTSIASVPSSDSQPKSQVVSRRLVSQGTQLKMGGVSQLTYIGQYQSSFLLCDDEEGLVLIDQHALHERIRYEELQQKEMTLSSQTLFLPKKISLTSDEAALFPDLLPLLSKFRLDCDLFSQNWMIIRAYPTILAESEIEGFVKDCFLASSRGRPMDKSQLLESTLASLACHSSLRAHMSVTREMAEDLLSQYDQLENRLTCPHGRPIQLRFLTSEIYKHFKRS